MRNKEYSAKELKQILKGKYPSTPPIFSAPTFGQLIEKADKDGVSYDWIFRHEAEIEYSAIDSQANIFFMENPALMTYQSYLGATRVTRKPPRLMESGGNEKKEAKNSDGWSDNW